jgi:hypothetical protein
MPQSRHLVSRGARFRFARIAAGRLVVENFLLERRLHGAQNQILPRRQIARKYSLEGLPNAARRQLFARADGGADEARHGSLEKFARNLDMDGRRTRMSALVFSEHTLSCTSIIALITGEWALDEKSRRSGGRLRSLRSLGKLCAVRIYQLVGIILRSIEFPACWLGLGFSDITIDGSIIGQVLERGLNGTRNQIPPRPQIAREFSLEHLPNAACRQLRLLAGGDGDANELHDSGLKSLV